MRTPEALAGVDNKMAYSFPMEKGVKGVVFDAWVPPLEGPHGFLPQDQLIALEYKLIHYHKE